MLHIGVLGPFSLSFEGRPLANPSSETAMALLAYIAVENHFAPAWADPLASTPFHRRRLAELFWPGISHSYARKNLRQSLYAVRKALSAPGGLRATRSLALLSANRTEIFLNPNIPLELDVSRYLAYTHNDAAFEELEAAAALYRGEFLADIYLEDNSNFDLWLDSRRLEFRLRQLDLLNRLAVGHIIRHELDKAADLASAQLQMEPTSERANRQLMLVTALGGHRRAAIAQYRRFGRLLWEQLEIAPSQETERLHQAIAGSTLDQWLLANPVDGPGENQPTPESLPVELASRVPHNLPYLPRPLIGRVETLRQLRRMINSADCRLVTITGPGGIGKTLLSLTAAYRLLTDARRGLAPYTDGVFQVKLDQVTDLQRAYFAVAKALDLTLDASAEGFSSVEAQLRSFLRDRQLLLILDGVDDLLQSAAPLLEMLLECPGVQLLVTSSERLHSRAERIISLLGLSYPDLAAAKDHRWLEESEAAQLFLDAAQQVHPQFHLDLPQDGHALAQICRMTQGNPLALELAAGRAPFIGIGAVAAQLEHSLDILFTTNVDQPEPHRSMRAIFDNSWEHIDERQRRIISLFSVFMEGCTLEAAGQVTGATFSELIALAGKSLLVLDSRNRYDLPGVLRQYCADKLALRPAMASAAADAHSEYYCRLLLDWANVTDDASKKASLPGITVESGNILAAWRWSLAQGKLFRLVEIVRSLDHYFTVTGLFSESRAFFDQTVKTLRKVYGDYPQDPDAIRLICLATGYPDGDSAHIRGFHHSAERNELEANLRYALALLRSAAAQGDDLRVEEAFLRRRLAQLLGRQPEARIQAQLSRDLYQDAGHTRGSIELSLMVACHDISSEIPTEQLLELVMRAAVSAESIHDPYLIARALMVKSLIMRHRLNAPDRALSLLSDAYQIAVNNRLFADAISASRDAAWLNWSIGAYDHALQLQRQAADLARQNQLTISEATLLVEIGYTYFHMGDFPKAAQCAQKSIALDSDAGSFMGLRRLQALCALHQGDYDRAQRIAGLEEEPDCWLLRVKAWIAIADGDFQGAAELAALSEDYCPSDEYSLNIAQRRAWSSVALAAALQGLGRIQDASDTLRRCAEIIAPARALSPAVHLLPIAALQMAYQGRPARAAELLALAGTVPFTANSRFFQEFAGQRLAQLTQEISGKERQRLERQGRALDWWAVLDGLPQELVKPAQPASTQAQKDDRSPSL